MCVIIVYIHCTYYDLPVRPRSNVTLQYIAHNLYIVRTKTITKLNMHVAYKIFMEPMT